MIMRAASAVRLAPAAQPGGTRSAAAAPRTRQLRQPAAALARRATLLAPLPTRRVCRRVALPRCPPPPRAVLGGDALQVEALPADVRERAIAAVEQLGGRVTVGDVAAKAGLQLSEASSALNALATDTGAVIKVSDDGDLLYVYRSGVRAQLAAKSWRLRLAPVLAKAREAGAYVVRVAFGSTLFISILLVVTAITVLLSSRSDERDNRRGGGGLRVGGGFGFHPGLFDFYFWDPYYLQRRRAMRLSDPYYEMGFLESVFSFVFGDGDPNADFEGRRWAAVGELIQRSGGAVTAEQLAPLLEPPRPLGRGASSLAGASAFEDESFVLPALTRFNGVPELTAAGGIVYRFPDLRATGALPKPAARGRGSAKAAAAAGSPTALAERQWAFSEAPATNVAMTLLLGAANAAGVIFLTSLIGTPGIAVRAGAQTVAAVGAMLPALQAYAVLFFALPALRWTRLQRRNAVIADRNSARQEAAQLLAAPPPAVAAKLAAARSAAPGRQVVSDDRVVFSSDAADTRATNAQLADEGADFERRLLERERRRGKGDRDAPTGW